MHYLVKHSLLASLQTIRSVLTGMELLIKNSQDDEPQALKKPQQLAIAEQDDSLTPFDEAELARRLGLVGVSDGE